VFRLDKGNKSQRAVGTSEIFLKMVEDDCRLEVQNSNKGGNFSLI
jgi:hypothetical protein